MNVMSFERRIDWWEFKIFGLRFTKTPYGFKFFNLRLFGVMQFQDGWALTLFGIRLEKDFGSIEVSVGLETVKLLAMKISWRHYA